MPLQQRGTIALSLQIDTALLSFQTLVTSVKAYRLDVGLIPVTPTLQTALILSGDSSVPADLGRMASCVHVSHSQCGSGQDFE